MLFCIKKHMSQERSIFLKVKRPPSTLCILSYVSVTKISSMLHYLKVPNSKMAHLLRRVQIDLWALTILWPWKTDIGIKNQKPNTLEAASKNSGASALRECAWINVIRKNKEQKIIKICLRPKRISVFKLIWINSVLSYFYFLKT